MRELLILLIIGFSLSIDAFTASTVLGLTNTNNKKNFYISLIVGIFHFIMPIFGVIISNIVTKSISINSNFVLGVVLIFISLQMFIEYIKPSNKILKLNKINILLFALSVSLDSLTVGFALNAITERFILASLVFSICSFSLTFLGFTLGKYFSKLFKRYSYLLSILTLFILGIIFLCKSI